MAFMPLHLFFIQLNLKFFFPIDLLQVLYFHSQVVTLRIKAIPILAGISVLSNQLIFEIVIHLEQFVDIFLQFSILLFKCVGGLLVCRDQLFSPGFLNYFLSRLRLLRFSPILRFAWLTSKFQFKFFQEIEGFIDAALHGFLKTIKFQQVDYNLWEGSTADKKRHRQGGSTTLVRNYKSVHLYRLNSPSSYLSMSKAARKVPAQQIQRCQEPNDDERDYTEFENELDKLAGSEILEIFANEQNFLELCSISNNFPGTMNRFCWRLKYILGETFLYLQKRLANSQILQKSMLLDSSDVQELVEGILERGKMINQSKQFQNLKKVLETAFNTGKCDENAMLATYGYCLKMWKPPISFDMDRSSYGSPIASKGMSGREHPEKQNQRWLQPNIISKEVNPRHNPKKNLNDIYKMPINSQMDAKQIKISRNLQPLSRQNSSSFKISKQIESKPPASDPEDETINLNDGVKPGKCVNRNWNLKEQQVFCRAYVDCENSEGVKAQLEKKLGVDARWSVVKQIDSKMHTLIAKIFKKFEALETINPKILKFRTLKSFILSSENINDRQRRTLNKLFAIIYDAMLNVNHQKKQIISEKLIQVVHICEQIPK